ncbi:hypothetical protein [Bacillus thermotolerans]|uniref:hypothetical protein n=1 Tax=Bacillus thermotolerans TaxID=1221996 RepID=UPI000F67C0C5|nr:hypothetical protein [Bacillus thermotolerans]
MQSGGEILSLLLERTIKKKETELTPADESEVAFASFLYYQVYGKDLPVRDYRKLDIQYIIQLLQSTINTGRNELESEHIH